MSHEAQPVSSQENRLIYEKSPYLLQHAHNPVDWYPWGDEAFARAKQEDKPIFLSIGYSTCHWCHVMERESFEDSEVARLMNETFISIKVDREERPDIDNVYMSVCQMLTGSGGWPLTIIMTPDKLPFFAGTYFPKESKFGRIGMVELVPKIKEAWNGRREDLLQSAEQIMGALQQNVTTNQGRDLDGTVLQTAYNILQQRYDDQYGGFGSGNKFPTPHVLFFLLRYWKRHQSDDALRMVEKTLQAMRKGGIYDHIGFGFHRYSTDSRWLVPHFEKMLYDQALIAMAYIEAFQATGREEYAATAREIFTYVLRDMTDPGGGFYSAEDADSEGEEGKFYLWDMREIESILGNDGASLMRKVFNIDPEGNFTDEASGHRPGNNILHLTKSMDILAHEYEISEAALRQSIEEARQELFAVRERRIHPYKDDKILTDWNGLMIAALAKGAQVLEEPVYLDAARKAVEFIEKKLRLPDGRLLHRYRDGEAGLPANVDDYAFLIWGLLELYEATFDAGYLQTALDLNIILVERFWDDANGAFYFTRDDAADLPVRSKEIYDGAVPSGNSVAMLNLLRLSRITANTTFDDLASGIGRAFSSQVSQSPSAYTQLMLAVDFSVGPSYEIVIAGETGSPDAQKLLRALRAQFIPNKVVLMRPGTDAPSLILDLAPYTKNQRAINGRTTVYVCQNYACNLPTTDVNEMLAQLQIE